MDAQLVWRTWRRILRDDRLVEWLLHPKDSGGVLFQFYHEDEEHEHTGPAGHELEPTENA